MCRDRRARARQLLSRRARPAERTPPLADLAGRPGRRQLRPSVRHPSARAWIRRSDRSRRIQRQPGCRRPPGPDGASRPRPAAAARRRAGLGGSRARGGNRDTAPGRHPGRAARPGADRGRCAGPPGCRAGPAPGHDRAAADRDGRRSCSADYAVGRCWLGRSSCRADLDRGHSRSERQPSRYCADAASPRACPSSARGRRGANRAVGRPPVRVPLLPSRSAVGRIRGRFKPPALVWVSLPPGIAAVDRVRAPLGLLLSVRLRQRRKLPVLARRRQRRKLPVLARRRQRRKLVALIWRPVPLGIAAVVRARALPRLSVLAGPRQRLRLPAIVRILVLPERTAFV